MELGESVEVEEVSTIIAEAGKPGYVDLSVEMLDPEDENVEETCTSSDADSMVGVLEKSIEEVVMKESSPARSGRAKAVEDKEDTTKDGVDIALRKRKSGDEEDLLERGMEVTSIEEVECPSSVEKLVEKPGIISSCSIVWITF